MGISETRARVPVRVGRVSVPVLEIKLIVGRVRVLFVRVSTVSLPTIVSVEVGRVRVPVLVMELITGTPVKVFTPDIV